MRTLTRPLILWDIDGTLLSTSSAGREALDRAFEELFGVPRAFEGVSFGGRTDNGILSEAFARAGLEQEPHHEPLLQRRYLGHLHTLLGQPGRARLYPGVRARLDELEGRVTHALLTGNWREGAQAKLGAVGLWERFGFGAFADDSPVRDALVPVARARAQALGLAAERIIVIGDTPHDVACARAGGAVAVAVCTGWSSEEELRACGPDLLLPDLERGRAALLALVLGEG